MEGHVPLSSSTQGFSRTSIATWEEITTMWPLSCTSPPSQSKAKEQEKEGAFSDHLSLKLKKMLQLLCREKLTALWRHQLPNFHLPLTCVFFTFPKQCCHHSREDKMTSRSSVHLGLDDFLRSIPVSHSVAIGYGSEASSLTWDPAVVWQPWLTATVAAGVCYADTPQMTQTSYAVSCKTLAFIH